MKSTKVRGIKLFFIIASAIWLIDAIADFVIFWKIPFLNRYEFIEAFHVAFMDLLTLVYLVASAFVILRYIKRFDESEARYQQLFDNITDLIYIQSPVTSDNTVHFTHGNLATCRELNYNHKELVQLSPADIVPPDKLPELSANMQELLQKKHILYQTIHVAKDGRRIPVEINAHVVTLQGRPAILSIARDITERKRAEEALQRAHDEQEERVRERTAELQATVEKLHLEIAERLAAQESLRQSEERFRSAFYQSPVGAVIVDHNFRFQQVNPTYCRIVGYTAEELSSMSVEDVVHPEDLAKGMEESKRFFTGEIDGFRLEERNIRKDGAVIWIDLSVNLIQELGRLPRYFLAIIQDITARKQAELNLRESEQKLRVLTSQILTAEETERRRIATELHDGLGQSLMLLKFKLSAFIDKACPSKDDFSRDHDILFNYLDEVIEIIRRLSRDLSISVLEELGLSSALRYLLGEFSKHFNLALSSIKIDNIDQLFSAATQINIYRIFQESLTNIARHAQARSISVAIEHRDDYVIFSVQDDGKGFDVNEVADLKHPERSIGLTAMQERARIAGGSLDVWSRGGSGTRVTFMIPIDETINGQVNS